MRQIQIGQKRQGRPWQRPRFLDILEEPCTANITRQERSSNRANSTATGPCPSTPENGHRSRQVSSSQHGTVLSFLAESSSVYWSLTLSKAAKPSRNLHSGRLGVDLARFVEENKECLASAVSPAQTISRFRYSVFVCVCLFWDFALLGRNSSRWFWELGATSTLKIFSSVPTTSSVFIQQFHCLQ